MRPSQNTVPANLHFGEFYLGTLCFAEWACTLLSLPRKRQSIFLLLRVATSKTEKMGRGSSPGRRVGFGLSPKPPSHKIKTTVVDGPQWFFTIHRENNPARLHSNLVGLRSLSILVLTLQGALAALVIITALALRLAAVRTSAVFLGAIRLVFALVGLGFMARR
jgi:hypothetical protein